MQKKKPGPSKGKKHIEIQRSPLGESIYRKRRARGLTQEQLGEKVGVSKRMVAHYEAGSKAITIAILQKIAGALNVTVNALLSEKNNTEPEPDLKPALRRRFNILKRLPQQDQRAIFRIIDLAAEKAGITDSN